MTTLSANDNQQWYFNFRDNDIYLVDLFIPVTHLFVAQNSRLSGAWRKKIMK